MRSLTSQVLVPVLVSLLVLTTPIGTGQGVHASELLHPLLPHVHLIGGQIVSDEQLALARAVVTPDRVTSQPQTGPALGASAGAAADGLGIALGPTLPSFDFLMATATRWRLSVGEGLPPREFRDAPQDPPPTTFA